MGHALPETVETLVGTVLAEIEADPRHQLPHQRRRELYATIRAHMDQSGANVLGWLAVMTAERVHPIFQESHPDDTLPRELLDTAVGVLRGAVDDRTVAEMEDLAYHASGNGWGYDEVELPWPADMAAQAAYHALMEARGREPLQHLDRIHVLGEVDLDSGELSEYPEPISGEQFTDEQLCTDINSDTAAPAAVASSCNAGGPACDPEKLRLFWTWWLTEAIPQAWKTAHEEAGT